MRHEWELPAGYAALRFRAMDSDVLVLVPDERLSAAAAVELLFGEWELALSRFRPESQLSRLNAAGGSAEVREPLRSVLRRALLAAKATDGIFDPTMGADLTRLGYATTFGRLGGDVREPAGQPRIGTWRDVRIGATGVVTMPPGLAVDLGGIAKGMAVDRSLDGLRDAGVDSALVSAGGDLAVTGTLPGGVPWPIQVESGTVTLHGGALATSSVERRRWRTPQGVRHHLLDPRTRRPAASDVLRVSVHASTCEAAEVAAKTALILGPEQGRGFLERHGLSGIITSPTGSTPVGAWPGARARVA